jgi:glutamyl-tRNA synthetase
MEITHVIRGDDHLSNTPKQIQLYNALGWMAPEFTHLSMILGPDGSRLSKRHGATSVLEYKKMGYLPETLSNYLALLGWSTEDSQQLFGREELINEFSLERCSKSSAKFDTTKLLWMNGEYIRKKNIGELYCTARESGFLESNHIKNASKDYIRKAIELEHDKIKLLCDIPALIGFFFNDNIEYKQQAVDKALAKPDIKQMLIDIKSALEELDEFNIENLEKSLRNYAEGKNIKTSRVFHPVRVAVSGKTTGPGLFEMLEFLGKEKVIKRIGYTIEKILL